MMKFPIRIKRTINTCGKLWIIFAISIVIIILSAPESDWMPSHDVVDKIESHIVMPEGAPPLQNYSRYYSGRRFLLWKTVIGVFLYDDHADRKKSINIIKKEEFPVIFDGGCRFIRFEYDINSDRIQSIACNSPL